MRSPREQILAFPAPPGPSIRARALAGALRMGWRPLVDHVPGRHVAVALLRTALDTGAYLVRLEPGVTVRDLDDVAPGRGGASGPVAGDFVEPAETAGPGAILYLHGGGYAFCSPRTHRVITGRLAAGTGLPIVVPRYRMAPEYPFPAAFEDAVAAYEWLLGQGVPATRIVVAGDSSGGHLATALVAGARQAGLPLPCGVVLFSPWLDLTCELSARADRERRDPFISPVVAQRFGRLYVGDHDWSDPRLSLLDCEDLALPPFLIQVGGREALRGEAERLADTLTASGTPCELQVWPGQVHGFHLLARVLPGARAALEDAASFVRASVGVRVGGEDEQEDPDPAAAGDAAAGESAGPGPASRAPRSGPGPRVSPSRAGSRRASARRQAVHHRLR